MSFYPKISYPIGGKLVQGGLPTANQILQFNAITNQWEFVAPSGTPHYLFVGPITADPVVSEFYPILSNLKGPGEASVQLTRTTDMTVTRMRVLVISNSFDQAITLHFRDDGANVVVISVGPGLIGQFDSGVISVDVAAGSLINFISENFSGAGLVTFMIYLEYI